MKKSTFFIIASIIGIILVVTICFFIFGENYEYSIIATGTFSITLGILNVKPFYDDYIAEKKEKMQ